MQNKQDSHRVEVGGDIPGKLPEHDLRMVEVKQGEFGLLAKETTYGQTTRLVFDCSQRTHSVELDPSGMYELARLMGVGVFELPETLEGYLYEQDTQLTDVMDMLDLRKIPYSYSLVASGGACRKGG